MFGREFDSLRLHPPQIKFGSSTDITYICRMAHSTQKRKQGETTCNTCGITFLKDLSEIQRNEKLERNNFCSRNCAGKFHIERLKSYERPKGKGIRKSNPLSPLKEFIRRVQKRKFETDLDLEYLQNLWLEQKGICIYSKVQLILPSIRKGSDYLYTASLDRIDSSKGYIKGNVQFISIAMNFLKNKMSHEKMLETLELIKSL